MTVMAFLPRTTYGSTTTEVEEQPRALPVTAAENQKQQQAQAQPQQNLAAELWQEDDREVLIRSVRGAKNNNNNGANNGSGSGKKEKNKRVNNRKKSDEKVEKKARKFWFFYYFHFNLVFIYIFAFRTEFTWHRNYGFVCVCEFTSFFLSLLGFCFCSYCWSIQTFYVLVLAVNSSVYSQFLFVFHCFFSNATAVLFVSKVFFFILNIQLMQYSRSVHFIRFCSFIVFVFLFNNLFYLVFSL